MKKILGGMAAIALGASYTSASAQTVPGGGGSLYLGVGLGGSYVVNDDLDVFTTGPDGPNTIAGSMDADWGGTGSVFIGYRITDRISLEAESSAWVAKAPNLGEDYVGRSLLSVNAVLWGDRSAAVIPYVGFGIGHSRFNVTNLDGDLVELDSGFGYKIKGGALLPVGRSHAFGAEASFVSGDTVKNDFAGLEAKFNAIGLAATYRYQFGGYPGR